MSSKVPWWLTPRGKGEGGACERRDKGLQSAERGRSEKWRGSSNTMLRAAAPTAAHGCVPRDVPAQQLGDDRLVLVGAEGAGGVDEQAAGLEQLQAALGDGQLRHRGGQWREYVCVCERERERVCV